MRDKNSFFKDLVSNHLIDKWAKNIDWLLNENKFEKWEKGKKNNYTKIIKNHLKTNNIEYKIMKSAELQNENLKRKKYDYIYIIANESQCIDLIRHIRNGIAHGHCNVIKKKDKLYLNIIILILKEYQQGCVFQLI